MDIGERIRQSRKEKGLKQEELAEKASISRVAVGNYERSDRIPPLDIAGRIADALGVSLDYLMTGDTSETTDDELLNRIAMAFPDAAITETDEKTSIQIIPSSKDKRPLVEILREETIRHYDSMNSLGQQRAYENVKDLAKIDEYKKKEK